MFITDSFIRKVKGFLQTIEYYDLNAIHKTHLEQRFYEYVVRVKDVNSLHEFIEAYKYVKLRIRRIKRMFKTEKHVEAYKNANPEIKYSLYDYIPEDQVVITPSLSYTYTKVLVINDSGVTIVKAKKGQYKINDIDTYYAKIGMNEVKIFNHDELIHKVGLKLLKKNTYVTSDQIKMVADDDKIEIYLFEFDEFVLAATLYLIKKATSFRSGLLIIKSNETISTLIALGIITALNIRQAAFNAAT